MFYVYVSADFTPDEDTAVRHSLSHFQIASRYVSYEIFSIFYFTNTKTQYIYTFIQKPKLSSTVRSLWLKKTRNNKVFAVEQLTLTTFSWFYRRKNKTKFNIIHYLTLSLCMAKCNTIPLSFLLDHKATSFHCIYYLCRDCVNVTLYGSTANINTNMPAYPHTLD